MAKGKVIYRGKRNSEAAQELLRDYYEWLWKREQKLKKSKSKKKAKA